MPHAKNPPAILNTLTAEEITEYRLAAERSKQGRGSHPGICLWCEREFVGRADKVFCSAGCKAKYHKAAVEIEVQRLATRVRVLEAEREELVREIAELRREK